MTEQDSIVLTEFKSEVEKNDELLAQAVMLEAQNIRYRQTLLTIFKTLTKDEDGNMVVKLESEEGEPDKYLNVFMFISHLLEIPVPKRTTLQVIHAIQKQCIYDFTLALSTKLTQKLPGSAAFRDGFRGAIKWLIECMEQIRFIEVPHNHGRE